MFSNRAIIAVAAGAAYLTAITLNAGMSLAEYRKGLEESSKGVYDSGLQQDWLAYSGMQRDNLTSEQLLIPFHGPYFLLVERPPEARVKNNADGNLEMRLIEFRKKAKVSVKITFGAEEKK